MSLPKRHHYLPQFYLRGFCRDDSFCIFDRDKNEFRVQTPINTAVQKQFYSVRNEDGSFDPALEKLLSQVEAETAPIIAKLDGGGTISFEEKYTLSIFVGLQNNRIPDFKKQLEEMRRGILEKIGDNVAPATEEEIAEASSVIPLDEAGPPIPAFELVQNLQAMENNPDLAHNDFLRMIIPMSMQISRILFQMSWVIGHTPNDTAFITTDCPFIILPPQGFDPTGLVGYGIGTPGAVKLMPLSSRSCLIILDQGHGFKHISTNKKDVRGINLRLAVSCDRYLIAAEEQYARFLVKRSGIGNSSKGPRIIIE